MHCLGRAAEAGCRPKRGAARSEPVPQFDEEVSFPPAPKRARAARATHPPQPPPPLALPPQAPPPPLSPPAATLPLQAPPPPPPPRARIVWDVERQQRFVNAVNALGGIDKATAAPILCHMGDADLTRENVASHLQKYKCAF